ncbi:MAG: hypothetical protein WCI52_01855 [bacterium]
MFGLSKKELALFKKLSTPIKIQDFLDTLPINFEENGETYMSPRRVILENKAHCMEGALFAAAVLWFHGQRPLLLDLQSLAPDCDHVVALYKINNRWGAISKSNHSTLRFRDPVYKTVRELAVSYFHEYFINKTGKKTLVAFSKPFNLKRLGQGWVTEERDLWHIVHLLDNSPHESVYGEKSGHFIRKADKMEVKAGKLLEWGSS